MLPACVAALVIALLGVGCGGSSEPSHRGVTLIVGSSGYPVQYLVIGAIYAQALEDAGYTVHKRLGVVSPSRIFEELHKGELSAYPTTSQIILRLLFHVEDTELARSEPAVYRAAQRRLRPLHLLLFPRAPAGAAVAVGTLRSTAERLHLRDISDLKGKSEKMTLSGAPECPELAACLIGLRKTYRLKFKAFKPTYIAARYEVFTRNHVDLSMLYETDALLAGTHSKYVTLKDDKHAFPAGNDAAVLTSEKAVKEAGPAFEQTVVEAQRGLTVPVLRKLDAQVELDGESPSAVAAAYLESVDG